MNPDFLNRDVNANFSGGEKKRNEILQLFVLEVRPSVHLFSPSHLACMRARLEHRGRLGRVPPVILHACAPGWSTKAG